MPNDLTQRFVTIYPRSEYLVALETRHFANNKQRYTAACKLYGKIIPRLLFLVLSVLHLCACTSHVQKNTMVLEYADFGPQVMAYPALGPKNLSWQPEVPLLLGQGKVCVVVYRDIALGEVKQHYPADKHNHLDYRYLQYSDALHYLDSRIAQNILRSITERLLVTRDTIRQRLR